MTAAASRQPMPQSSTSDLPSRQPERVDPLVDVTGLAKRFGRLEVLRGVDVGFRRARVTAVIGPNGSGKTTLIKAVLGLVRPDAGTVAFDGEIVEPGDVTYRSRVGYMPQRAAFPENLTGREVLTMLRDLRAGDARQLDEMLLQTLALEPELDKPLRTLSGGNRQKVNAAVAFLFRPDLIVLDEPTAGLDPVASSALKEAIRSAKARGVTFVLTSHIVSELEELADDIVFLLDGRALFAGTTDDLKRETGEDRLERAIAHLMISPR
ncbi:MAG: ABC transporter ATP-binding protein [Bacteroidota bacterium]